MKVAIIHYWLIGMRGGERVLEEICRLYPQADIFTHVALPANLSDVLRRHRIYETFIARLPGGRRHYQKYLPLMPLALESLDLRGYDLVISSEAGPAKGVICDPDALHVCYCHSPMRYIWDMYHTYREQSGFAARTMMTLLAPPLRTWDTTSAGRVDHVVANSRFIAGRIAKAWRREATVIHPPVAYEDFRPPQVLPPEDFYLFASELVGYKRPDLVVRAFNENGRPLVVIGDGKEHDRLKAMAGDNVSFLGKVSFDVLRDHYARCRALVFPGIEDFGIVPLEVAASGRPVLAYGRGGALETVLHRKTGLHFGSQTPEAINAAVDDLEANYDEFKPDFLYEHAKTFGPEVFREKFKKFVDDRLAERKSENDSTI